MILLRGFQIVQLSAERRDLLVRWPGGARRDLPDDTAEHARGRRGNIVDRQARERRRLQNIVDAAVIAEVLDNKLLKLVLAIAYLLSQFVLQNKYRFHQPRGQAAVVGGAEQLPGMKLLEQGLTLGGHVGNRA